MNDFIKTTYQSVFCLYFLSILAISSHANSITLTPKSHPWVRLKSTIAQLKVAPKGKFFAYISSDKEAGLNVFDPKEKKTYNVSKKTIGPSFFWSPDGQRLFFREMVKQSSGKIKSTIKVYDCFLKKSVAVDSFPHRTGHLTFDPRDLRFFLLHKNGIHARRIEFPNSRLARWQLAQQTNFGRWIVSQNGALWVSQGGLAMRRMNDDDSPIESFDVSPDGQSIAWATAKGRVYTSRKGATPHFVGHGRDPDWHLKKDMLIYAGARMVGDKASGYDLRLVDRTGRSRWVTQTQYSNERWPQWQDEMIVFTKEKTTDLYQLDFAP